MKLFDLIDESLFNEMVASKYIDVAKHPKYDLWIYDYSRTCTIDGAWNEATMTCRGIIVDGENNIVSWPFRKFFNYEELETLSQKIPELHLDIPNLSFKAYEKLDGSLGVGYWVDGKLYIATKGSFESDQAIKANEILNRNYPNISKKLSPNYTYLFEIIYPENRIVVDYGNLEDVVLIGVKDTANGEDIQLDWYRSFMSVVQEYEAKDWRTMREQFSGDNREGFVVRFSNGFRMKMKYEEYFKKHFLRTFLTEKRVYDYFYDGNSDELFKYIEDMDEETKIFVDKCFYSYLNRFARITYECYMYLKNNGLNDGIEVTKEVADIVKKSKYPSVCFSLLRGKDISRPVNTFIENEKKFENGC